MTWFKSCTWRDDLASGSWVTEKVLVSAGLQVSLPCRGSQGLAYITLYHGSRYLRPFSGTRFRDSLCAEEHIDGLV